MGLKNISSFMTSGDSTKFLVVGGRANKNLIAEI